MCVSVPVHTYVHMHSGRNVILHYSSLLNTFYTSEEIERTGWVGEIS